MQGETHGVKYGYHSAEEERKLFVTQESDESCGAARMVEDFAHLLIFLLKALLLFYGFNEKKILTGFHHLRVPPP